MTKIKFCGLTRKADIEAANALKPDFIGFVFAKDSRRYIPPESAAVLKSRLSSEINAVALIKAFRITSASEAVKASASSADMILLDSGTGSGRTFNWQLIKEIRRPYFLAGGLDPENVSDAVRLLHPWAVDVSSCIETDGLKDIEKMAAFAAALRKTFKES